MQRKVSVNCMQRYGVIVLAVVLLLGSVVACGGGEEPPPTIVPAAAGPVAATTPVAQTSGGEAAAPAGNAENGKVLFATTCAACHGPAGEGVQGLGKDMTKSEFIAGLSDQELLAFVKTGRPISDPLNTTKVDMPPKGGNPALSEAQLLDIIAFIRTIHVE